MKPLVSVVIPTYNRPQLLDRCLQALLVQDFDPQNFEIIVVDDGPQNSATRELVHARQHHISAALPNQSPPNGSVRLINSTSKAIPLMSRSAGADPSTAVAQADTENLSWAVSSPRLYYLPAWNTQGPAAARNLGWRFAQGKILAFTDDDTIPDPGWLRSGTALFQGEVVGVSGRVLVPLPDRPSDNARNTTGLESSHFVTANCFYLRSALEAVGGFDERFQAAWREDSDLYFTLHKRGCSLAWSNEAIVVHPVRPEPWGSSIGQQRKSFYNALLYKKHPDLYWKIIQPSPPWDYYGILMSALAAALGGVLSIPPLLVLGGAGWLILMGRFVVRRLKGTSFAPEHLLEILLTSLVIPFLSVYWRLRGAVHWRVFFL